MLQRLTGLLRNGLSARGALLRAYPGGQSDLMRPVRYRVRWVEKYHSRREEQSEIR